VKISAKEAEISVKEGKDLHQHTKKELAEVVKKWAKEIEVVKFVDVYGK
jgi:hypothetical protein